MRAPRPNEAVNQNLARPESAESFGAVTSTARLAIVKREFFGALSETWTSQQKAQIIGQFATVADQTLWRPRR